MTDVHEPEIRSRNMRAIRHKNTRPELQIRSLLHRAGFRFRLHGTGLPGKPDIVLPKYRAAIFVHGCFWHGHDCHLFRLPATRTEFWRHKIQANRDRDARDFRMLRDSGWRVLTVWECMLKGKERLPESRLSTQLTEWLSGGNHGRDCKAAG